jgi:hypothetical protein
LCLARTPAWKAPIRPAPSSPTLIRKTPGCYPRYTSHPGLEHSKPG